MSGSTQSFFEDLGNRLEQAADAIEREARDIANDANGVLNDAEREATDIANDVNSDRGAPSTTSPAAQVTRLYDAVFDRAPDDAGLTFWTNALRAGAGLNDLAEVFVASPEFRDTYGDLGNGDFVARLYQNVLNREGDPDGQAFWTSGLESGRYDRDDVVVAFSESPEHVALVGPVATGDNPLI